MVETRQVHEGLAVHDLDAAAGVRRTVAEQPATHAVRHPRLGMAQPGVAPLHPVAHHELRVAALGEQRRDIGRIVLAVAVERGDPPGARMTDTGADGRALPGAERVREDAQLRDVALQGAQRRGGAIGAAVVDEQDLEDPAVQGCDDLARERTDVLLLVADRDHHRHFRRSVHGGGFSGIVAPPSRTGGARRHRLCDHGQSAGPSWICRSTRRAKRSVMPGGESSPGIHNGSKDTS